MAAEQPRDILQDDRNKKKGVSCKKKNKKTLCVNVPTASTARISWWLIGITGCTARHWKAPADALGSFLNLSAPLGGASFFPAHSQSSAACPCSMGAPFALGLAASSAAGSPSAAAPAGCFCKVAS